MTRILLAALAVLNCLILAAQDFRATILGQVVDSTGAAIAGAKIRAVQQNTNEVTEVTATREGFYTLPYLQPSTYSIEVTAPGFATSRRENVTLMVAQKLELPFKLEVGQMSQAITVTAEPAELIQTADASGGLNFDGLMTSEFALNGRQVYMLMDLAPGVLFTQEEFGATGFSGTRAWDVNGNFVMNGGKVGTNSFSLNGAPISLTGSFQLAPNVDAIQEFKVMTNTYDASLGRTGGGAVNTTLKSGSNQWHGTLFNYMRNRILDANHTQLNAAGEPRGKRITNQFGGTIGGALRRDKDFLFVSFEGFRERVPFPVVADTPPLDLRTGEHFTEYRMNIYDPLTSHPCVNGVDVPGTCSSPYIRNPFPGNVLPESRMSPIGRKLLSFYPEQNVPGMTDNFVFSGGTGKYRYEQPMARWDRVIDQYNRVYALFTFQDGREYRNSTGIRGPASAGNMFSRRRNMNFIATFTRILSPTAILDLRASFGRFGQRFPNANTSSEITVQDLGMTQMVHAPTSNSGHPPRITIDQFSNLFGSGANFQTWKADNQWNHLHRQEDLQVRRGPGLRHDGRGRYGLLERVPAIQPLGLLPVPAACGLECAGWFGNRRRATRDSGRRAGGLARHVLSHLALFWFLRAERLESGAAAHAEPRVALRRADPVGGALGPRQHRLRLSDRESAERRDPGPVEYAQGNL